MSSWWRASCGENRSWSGGQRRPLRRAHHQEFGSEWWARYALPTYAQKLSSPAVLPDLLADHAIDARRLFFLAGNRHHRTFRRAARDFEQQLGADRLLEFLALLDRH